MRKHGRRAFSMLELVASIAIFAAFTATVIAAVQAARSPQYVAQSRYEILELVTDLVSNEAADPQVSMFTEGVFTPDLSCGPGSMKSCVSLGNTDYEISWTVTQRHDLGSVNGTPSAVSISASVVAADGTRYTRSAIALSDGVSGTNATVRVRIVGDRLSTSNNYTPIEVLDEDSEVVAALTINPLTMDAYGSFDASSCTSGCTIDGQPISVSQGQTTDVVIESTAVSTASTALGSTALTVPQGHTADATLTGSGSVAFENGLGVWASSCDLPNDCAVFAASTASPGTYAMKFTTTNGQYGVVNVTVTEAAVGVFVSDVNVAAGSTAAIPLSVISGSGNPIAAQVCVKPAGASTCEVTVTTDSVTGSATASITAPTTGLWEAEVPGTSAIATFYLDVLTNAGSLAAESISFDGGTVVVAFSGLAEGTELQVSNVPNGVFGPSGTIFADANGEAAVAITGADDLSAAAGTSICIFGSSNCVVLS